MLDDRAYWLSDVDARAADIGPATAVYEAMEPGSVWLITDGGPRRVEAATGAILQTVDLPPLSVLARTHSSGGAAVAEGLVLRQPDGTVGVLEPVHPIDRVDLGGAGPLDGGPHHRPGHDAGLGAV